MNRYLRLILVILACAIVIALLIYNEAGGTTDNATAYKEWESVEQFSDMFAGGITAFEPDICLFIAREIQASCLEQGLPVSVAFTKNHSYYGRYVTKTAVGHAGIVLEVKEVWYFVDPVDWRVTKLW